MKGLQKHIRKTTLRPKKSSKEYFIWCDESDKTGKYFSNFYGGVLVKSEHLKEVQQRLKKVCDKLHLFDELKWDKVSEHYVDKYIQLMDIFFDCIEEWKIKVRIMFTQNAYVAKGLTNEQKEDEFFLLYYQFISMLLGLYIMTLKTKFISGYILIFYPIHLRKDKFLKNTLNVCKQSPFPAFESQN